MDKKINLRLMKVHALAWTGYISYDFIIYYLSYGTYPEPISFILSYFFYIPLFYFNSYVVLPASVKANHIRYARLVLMMLAELAAYVIIRYLSYWFLIWIKDFPRRNLLPLPEFIAIFCYKGIRMLGLSIGYWFALRTYYNRKKINDLEIAGLQNQLKKEELQKTLLVTENAYLKSQINPHFLLNTLNFLYNSVSKFSDKIADSVMTLSEMMRYALTNAGDDSKVNLVDELDQVANLVKLSQTRFSERLQIRYELTGDPQSKRIIPLALVTLVENVFKYGDLLNETHPARITAQIDNNLLTFSTFNLKKKNVREKSHGIGIKNVTERLKMYHQYDLKIEENEQFYKSVLKVWL